MVGLVLDRSCEVCNEPPEPGTDDRVELANWFRAGYSSVLLHARHIFLLLLLVLQIPFSLP